MSNLLTYRLADYTVVHPLINHWSAWSYLMSPVPASLHLLYYQLKTLKSFLDNPDLHVEACKNPDFIGSAFVNLPKEKANKVNEFLLITEEKQSKNIEFAQSITDFYNWLIDEVKGQNLEPYYSKLPERLHGYVELVYDYYNRVSIRFLEGLLYESQYYNKSLQSLRILQLNRDDERPFFMSTPYLLQDNQIDWSVPFEDSRIDEFFNLDSEPKPLGYIREILNLSPADERYLLPFLSKKQMSLPETWNEEEVRIRYFGHACVLVEWKGVSILTDPFIAVTPSKGGISRLTYNDLPKKIDYVLITHNHCDHFFFESLLRLRHRIHCLVVPKSSGILYGDTSLKLMAQKLGFKYVYEIDIYDSIDIYSGEIIAIPFLGEHADLAHAKTGYVIRAGKQQILFAADSNCLDKQLYKNVCNTLGSIETVFLGTEPIGAPLTWSYGSLFLKKPPHKYNQSRRQKGCDAKAALDILETVGAKRIYNYGMGLEPWLKHILAMTLSEDSSQIQESNKLIAKARERNFLVAERLFGKCDIYLS